MSDMQSIIGKINKLLNLADTTRGATEAEAASAAAKVQELLQAHGLSMAEVATREGKASEDASPREKREVERVAKYEWQKNLMNTIAETNFVYHQVNVDTSYNSETGGRRRNKKHILIGRTLNVEATLLVYDYLTQSMKRLVREAGYAPGSHNEQGYHYWLQGCSERLCERLERKADEAKEASERKAREEKTRAAHPSAAPSTSGALVVLSDVYGSEEDLNADFRRGVEPGTTARERAEMQARARARDARHEQLVAAGMNTTKAWYIACGYSEERANELLEEREDTDKKSSRRSSSRGSRRESRWTAADEKRAQRERDPAYKQGKSVGDSIGLDQQVEHQAKKRIG